MKDQKGFTLIELVVVIVILGILAAVAVPRFVDLSDEANTAALQAVAGAVESASAINYAAAVAGDGAAVAIQNGDSCSTFIAGPTAGILQADLDTSKYSVNGTVTASGAGSVDTACVITQVGSTDTINPTIILTQ